MKTITRWVAAAELLLIFPAALFMGSLLVRGMQPLQYEPAHTAQRIVMLYAGKLWTLWILLIALPLAVLIVGCATLFREWNENAELRREIKQSVVAVRAHIATLLVAVATVAAGCFLAVVAVHMMAG